MLTATPATAQAAAPLPLFAATAAPDKVSGLFHAATLLAQLLGQGRALDSRALRSATEAAFGASDADGAWVWKDAYEAGEAAQVLFLRKFGGAMRARANSPAALLDMLTRLVERLPSQTRRSEESERLQQFSTPITLGFVAAEAAALTPADFVLEPSAGTGLLAIFAELAKARLALNEIAEMTAMKCPTLIAAIARDLDTGHAAIVQIVSTNEALLDRRLAEIPTSEWGDLSIDITPREYVLDYLSHSFPVQLFELFTDDEGNLQSRPAYDADGNPVVSRDAVERRGRMIEHLASLPPVQGALDQILHRFGADLVAEVTGRSRRIVKRDDRLCVETRPASANFAETSAFMDDDKRILVFSDAGGTGRSYHADLGVRNQRRRVHYLLEPGWKADAAIQGLGRSNRTNQKQPPLFRPVATDVKGEKRFLSTIARRLDTLGAITRGQRQTGGQGLFRADDNLESAYAKAALRQFYQLLYAGRIDGCSLTAFEDATGLDLCDQDGSLREDLPPITQFLNRILALRIALQNTLFATFDELLEARIEGALAAGTFDIGVETLTAESFRVAERRTVYTHAATGAETRCYRVLRKDCNRPLLLAEALALAIGTGTRLLINEQSHRAAVQAPAASLMQDDGSIEARTRLIRPMARETITVDDFGRSHWRVAPEAEFAPLWDAEYARVPEFAESAFSIITGLLLPIWDRLPAENMRVYRFETDEGERVIGRLVTPEALDRLYQGLGAADGPELSHDEAWTAVIERGAVLDLAGGLQIRRSLVMGAHRVELTGFSDGAVDRLKALGLTSEIIAWHLRLFVPIAEDRGPAILEAILDRHPLLGARARVAA